jgi:hypothetical protein
MMISLTERGEEDGDGNEIEREREILRERERF